MSSERADSGSWILRNAFETSAPRSVILVRVAVGVVFASEGVQKFLYPDALGAGRFAKIGMPAPEVLGPFVGGVEIVCGSLVLAGLAVRSRNKDIRDWSAAEMPANIKSHRAALPAAAESGVRHTRESIPSRSSHDQW